MSTPHLLVPGFIPAAGIYSAAELDSIISGAYPATGYGFVYKGATAPDTVTYPILKYFLWLDTTVNQIKLFDDNTLAWVVSPIANNSLNGAVLIDKTVSVGKLDPGVGNVGKVARVNGAGTAVSYDAPLNLYASNSFPIAKLVKGANDTLLYVDGAGTIQWTDATTLINSAEIAADQIIQTVGADNKVLGQLAGLTTYQYPETWLRDKQTPVAKLLPGTGGYLLMTADDGSLVQWTALAALYDKLVAAKYYATAVASYQSLAAGSTVNFAHGLGAVPRSVRVVLVCTTNDVGYVAGTEVDAHCLFASGGTYAQNISADATYVSIRIASVTLQLINASNAAQNITTANWKLKAYANL